MKRLLIIFFFQASWLVAQISPGDLTKFHKDLEGMSNCTKCHNLGKQLSNDKCLNCHTEIRDRITQKAGYHYSAEVKNKECRECHSEHNGRNFEIIHFDKKTFDHNKTGFRLTGSHAGKECGKCHKNEFITDPDLRKRKDTFLGLNTKCSSCHEDIHQKTLGENCSSCHNTGKFKPTAGFDHDKARFALSGAHVKTQCDKCHNSVTRNGKPFTQFRGLKFQECTDCHKDIHNGKFGNDCTRCHTTASFKDVNKISFNHDKTNFALIGKHNSVECGKCHGSSLSSKPKHAFCYNCHKDFHKGEFGSGSMQRDCKECHNEVGFAPSLFTIDKHEQTEFKLTGSHLAVPCKDCHIVNTVWKFKLSGTRCVDCHKNPHGNEISSQFMGDDNCSGCHTTGGWNKISFDHAKTKFILAGKHATADCNDCHIKKGFTDKTYIFRSLGTECVTCHSDIHYGQFIQHGENDCGKCHLPDNWKPVKFNHAATRFPLDGAHSKVPCDQCHKLAERENKKFIKYKIEDITCAACHS